jgi:DNA topoisomerase-1
MPVPVEPLNKTCPTCGLPEDKFEKELAAKKTLSGLSGTATDLRQAMRDATHGELVIRTGRFGKFVACCRYPECKYTEPFLQKIDMVCPKCAEGEVVIKRSKKGKPFYGCSRYPDCDFASWNKPKPEGEKTGTQSEEG